MITKSKLLAMLFMAFVVGIDVVVIVLDVVEGRWIPAMSFVAWIGVLTTLLYLNYKQVFPCDRGKS